MKKITALFLALVMLALPVLGMAESPVEMLDAAVEAGRPLTTTITLVPGTLPVDEQTATLVSDVLNALAIRVSEQENQTAFSLLLSGNDVLNFATEEKDGLTYLKSNLLGQDVVAFDDEEGEKLLERVAKLMVDNGMMTEADLATFKAAIAEGMAAAETPDADAEDLDITAMTDVIIRIMETAKVEDVTAQPKNADPAAQVTTLTMTGDDIVDVYAAMAEMLKSSADVMAQMDQLGQMMDDGPMTGAELLDTMIAMLRETMAKLSVTCDVAIYTNADGDLVAMLFNGKGVNEENEVMNMEGNYARLTTGEGVTHNANLIAADDTNSGVAMSFSALENDAKFMLHFDAAEINEGVTAEPVISFILKMDQNRTETTASDLVDGMLRIVDEQSGEPMVIRVVVNMNAAKAGEDVTSVTDVQLYMDGMGLNGDAPLFGVKVEAVTGNELPTIADANALRPGAMNDEEFGAYLNSLMQNLQVALITAVQSLPASVLQMMMGN